MNWSKWSFKLLVYVFVINLSIAFITVYYPNFSGESSSSVFVRNIFILTLAQWIFIIFGLGLSILSIKHKEKRGFKFYLALIGHPTFVILNLLSAVYG